MTWNARGVRKQYHFWRGEHGLDAWDVDRLIQLSQNLPIEHVPIDDIAEIDTVYWFDGQQEVPTIRRVVDHVLLIQDVDLSHPIILGADGRVMDGMHRVARVLLEGGATIAAVRFADHADPDYRNCRPEDLPYE
jgi:hypothetical protein